MTIATTTVPVGANAPQRLDLTFTSSDIDLTTVTAVAWSVQKPDGTTTTWSSSIVSQTTTTLVTRHTFAAADMATAGTYVIAVTMTTAGGAFPTKAVAVVAIDTYNYTAA